MKKLNLKVYPLEINKINAIEEAFNELLEILAEKEIIKLEEENNELYKNKLDK